MCFAEWEALPERPHKCTGDWCCGFEKEKPTEKYNLETGKTVRSPFSDDNKWFTRMKTWIASQGFSPLPEDIPEINIAYSDYPTSNGERSDYSKDFTS